MNDWDNVWTVCPHCKQESGTVWQEDGGHRYTVPAHESMGNKSYRDDDYLGASCDCGFHAACMDFLGVEMDKVRSIPEGKMPKPGAEHLLTRGAWSLWAQPRHPDDFFSWHWYIRVRGPYRRSPLG